jgi:hypothetical protein
MPLFDAYNHIFAMEKWPSKKYSFYKLLSWEKFQCLTMLFLSMKMKV